MKIPLFTIACVAACATAEWRLAEDDLLTSQKQQTSIDLAFGVKLPESGLEALESELMKRSTPSSPLYGQWLSNEETHALVRPDSAHIRAIENHLAQHGIASYNIQYPTPNSDWIVARMSIDEAERVLGAEYALYQDDESGEHVARLAPESFVSFPPHVAEAIDVVEPTTRFPPKPKTLKHSNIGRSTVGTEPAGLRKLYSVNENGSPATNPTGQAVTGFLGQKYSSQDMATFWQMYGKSATGVDVPTIKTVGDAATDRFGGIEGMLDAEYMPVMGANIHTEFWGFAGRQPGNAENEPFLKWLYTMSNTTDATVPKVFSTSYGEDEDSVDATYALRCGVEFQKAGVRGISLLFASGDEGANCQGAKLVPMWPPSSPWITAVGGTNGEQDEQAAWLSSGGLSNRYPQPQWQQAPVQAYLSQHNANMPRKSAIYNATGRAYPDISAAALNINVVASGQLETVGGTSCASPITAGIFGLLVDARLAAGKSSLGYLNPLIYSDLAPAFTDITDGWSRGCFVALRGWPAAKSYDLVTGWGTPNYEKMKDVVMNLP